MSKDLLDQNVIESLVGDEAMDLDDLLAIDDKTIKKHEQESKESKKVKKKDKSVGKLSLGKILLISVLPATVCLVGGFVGGIMLGSSPVEEEKPVVTAISKQVPLVDRVTTIKDAQMTALSKQVADIIDTEGQRLEVPSEITGLVEQLRYPFMLNNLVSNATVGSIDGFLNALFNDNPKKSAESLYNEVKDYLDLDTATSGASKLEESPKSIQVRQSIQNMLEGNRFAKVIGTTVAKSGYPFASISAVLKDGSVIYNVIVPVSSDKGKDYNVLMIVRVNTHSNKIMSASYEGYVDGPTVDYYKNLSDVISNNIGLPSQEKDEETGNVNLPLNDGTASSTSENSDNSVNSESSSSSSSSESGGSVEPPTEPSREEQPNETSGQ